MDLEVWISYHLRGIYDGCDMGEAGGFVPAPVVSTIIFTQLLTFLGPKVSLRLGWQKAFLVLCNAVMNYIDTQFSNT